MTSIPSILETSYEVCNASSIKLPTSEVVPITNIGSVKLSPIVTIANVLYIIDFKFNFLYISKVTCTLNCFVIFFLLFLCLLEPIHEEVDWNG
jgi:hypothetical protein